MTAVASSFPAGESAGKSSRELALPRVVGVPEGGGMGLDGRAPHPAAARTSATTKAGRRGSILPEEVAQFFIGVSGGS